MGVMNSADPIYRIANASQLASMSTAVATSTEDSCVGWVEASWPVLSATHCPGGGGGGAGGPCVEPPSANATVEIDAMSRQVPKNRVSFDMFWFPFDDALVGNHSQQSAGLY
jgi:hypothetical protein